MFLFEEEHALCGSSQERGSAAAARAAADDQRVVSGVRHAPIKRQLRAANKHELSDEAHFSREIRTQDGGIQLSLRDACPQYSLSPWTEVQYPFSVLRARGRSADFQSAVSPNCIRQGVGLTTGVGLSQRLAECNSAIRQSITLRYSAALSRCEVHGLPAMASWPVAPSSATAAERRGGA